MESLELRRQASNEPISRVRLAGWPARFVIVGRTALIPAALSPPAISQNVALAHNRLAIIDISPAGGEPMANEDGTVWLVFNGEIYNFVELRARLESRGHRFHSRTDAEVIIHLYEEAGPPCVKQLDGIFAFAILDLKRDLLFLARDPIGVKPLFYAITPHHFLFGSEIKALLASSFITPAPDWQAISDFFTYSVRPGSANRVHWHPAASSRPHPYSALAGQFDCARPLLGRCSPRRSRIHVLRGIEIRDSKDTVGRGEATVR